MFRRNRYDLLLWALALISWRRSVVGVFGASWVTTQSSQENAAFWSNNQLKVHSVFQLHLTVFVCGWSSPVCPGSKHFDNTADEDKARERNLVWRILTQNFSQDWWMNSQGRACCVFYFKSWTETVNREATNHLRGSVFETLWQEEGKHPSCCSALDPQQPKRQNKCWQSTKLQLANKVSRCCSHLCLFSG